MRVRVRMYAQGFLFSYRHSVIRHSQRPFPLAKIIKKTRICKKNGIYFCCGGDVNEIVHV